MDNVKLFIPIKHNSVRVPGKNYRVLGKYRLYERCLYKFHEYKIFVDTDSDDIYNDIIFNENFSHVTCYKRKTELIGDDISVNKLIENFIDRYCFSHDIVCQIHVTSPFLRVVTLEKAFKMMVDENYDSVFGCDKIQKRMWRKESYGYCPVNHNPMNLENTQNLPEYYIDNSTFYMFKVSMFNTYKNRVGGKFNMIEIEHPENMDIDTEQDYAECAMIEQFFGRKIV